MSGGKGGKSQIVGYRYFMGLGMALGRGPFNEMVEIKVGDKVAWTGSAAGNTFFSIHAPDLFGGDAKEGGINGDCFIGMGNSTQVLPSIISDILPPPVPGFRGIVSLWFYGLVTSNNPYPKPWKMRIRRTTAGWDGDIPWYPEKCAIAMAGTTKDVTFQDNPAPGQNVTVNGQAVTFVTSATGGFNVHISDDVTTTAQAFLDCVNANQATFNAYAFGPGTIIKLTGIDSIVVATTTSPNVIVDPFGSINAMNPAHIIYECATNRSWGRGLPTAMLNDAAFRAAADTLHSENFGLCLRWNREDDIDKFIGTIVNHIGASIYIDWTTGLLTLKLIRKDYDPAGLPVFSMDSGLIDITEDSSSANDTTYNEVIVTYYDPLTDTNGQVRAQNLASMQSLGQIISTSIDYMGCPTSSLALRLAQRDLEIQSSELRKLKVKLNRSAWSIPPGGVFKITEPDWGIDSLIMRAGRIEEGPLTDGTITISAVQDVFGLPETSYIGIENPAWTPSDTAPRAVATRLIEEMNWRDLVQLLSPADLALVAIDSGAIKPYAKRPTDLATGYVIATSTDGVTFSRSGLGAWEGTALLDGAISFYDTAAAFDPLSATDMTGIEVGGALLIEDEIVRIDAIDFDTGALTIARGCVDTVPAEHADSVRIWFEFATPIGDGQEYTTGEDVFVKMLTKSSDGELAPAAAPTDTITIGGRQGRPYPPGDVQVDSVPFGTIPHIITGDIPISWAHRDRLTEADILLEHEAGSTGPEAGTTYNLRVYDNTSLVRTVSAIAADHYTYTTVMATTDGDPQSIRFELESERDSLASWQLYSFIVTRANSATVDATLDSVTIIATGTVV